jgi:hypothetical protein
MLLSEYVFEVKFYVYSTFFYLMHMVKNVCSIKHVEPLKERRISRIKGPCSPKSASIQELRDLIPTYPEERCQFTNDHSLQATVRKSKEIG